MSKKILVLEDEKNIMNNLVELLEAENFTVFTGYNGIEGTEKLKQFKPDLILCDIMMPHMNGIEFYNYVKKDFETRFIPFIFLTAKTDLSSIRAGLNLGVDDYITKPFSASDLLKSIEIRLKKQSEFNGQFNSLIQNINMYIPHELRTPLVAIIGFSELMLSDIESMEKKEIKEVTERILWSAHRLHNRIEKFITYSDLNLSASEGNAGEIDKTILINEEFLGNIIAEHYYVSERADTIKYEIEEALLKIHENRLIRLLKEILENAVKFSLGGSEITVTGKKANSGYIITVKDLGTGMSEEEIRNVGTFQQFSRETHSQEGNGLGLVIAKKILDMIGGSLSIESKKGSYTSVTVNIPLA